MKSIYLFLLSFAFFFTLAANEYESAEKELLLKNQGALSKLGNVRTKIQNEKIRQLQSLTEHLNALMQRL